MSAAGSALLDRWLDGDAQPLSEEERLLLDRLISAGLVHPVPDETVALPTVAFVVPVYDDADGLDVLLNALRRSHPFEEILVVDDASSDAQSIAAVTQRHGAELLRHEINRGPAAARNTGWRKMMSPGEITVRPEVVVFVDADVLPLVGAVHTMLAHFGDPRVGVVAPRVRAEPGGKPISQYECHDSPLDMGSEPAIVFPGTRLSYVPSAMLAIRTDVLQDADGFDEAMRYGEDVDLVWRIIHDGNLVRYEPRALAEHRNRDSVRSFARQRFTYGTAAAALAGRHGGKVAPLQLPAAPVAMSLAILFGSRTFRLAGVMGAVATSLPLARKLKDKVDEPNEEALRLTAMTLRFAVQGLATAATRSWAPVLLLWSSSRRVLALALVGPAMIDWVRARPATNPAAHIALRSIDHASYCAGVWAGVVQSGSVAALLPRIRLHREKT